MHQPPEDLESTLQLLLSPLRKEIPAKNRAAVAVILRQCRAQVTREPSSQLSPTTPILLEVLFIQRAVRATDPWSAHIAFPGGHHNPSDKSDFATAVRETQEELQLDLSNPEKYRLVGCLRDRYIQRSGEISTSVLAAHVYLQLPAAINDIPVPQPSEVSAVFWAPLAALHGSTPATHDLHLRRPRSILVRFFNVFRLQMPAVDVLPLAQDIVRTEGLLPPHALLWGITLDCVGDIIHALGGRRVDWPSALPGRRCLAKFVITLVDGLWWLRECIWQRSSMQKKLGLYESKQ